jgi:hypothetical protein
VLERFEQVNEDALPRVGHKPGRSLARGRDGANCCISWEEGAALTCT